MIREFANALLVLRRTALLARHRRSAVALMFGLLALPLTMIVGLAIDFSFYIQEKAQLDTATDTAAIHAVRVASEAYTNGQTTTAEIEKAGRQAGLDWFQAQLGSFSGGAVSPTVTVTYTPSPSTFTANVTYSIPYKTIFSALFNVSTFGLSSSATTTISNSYVEIVMLLDNSASMLIGATINDIVALEQATICAPYGSNGRYMGDDKPGDPNFPGNYSWYFTGTNGYWDKDTVPPSASKKTIDGQCDPRYTGDLAACTYAPNFTNVSPTDPYKCTNGGGSPLTVNNVSYPNMPNAPCALACHTDPNNNDYYGIARAIKPAIQLRLDVVQQAAANVVKTLQTDQVAPNQFSVGIYQFTTGLQQVFPTQGSGEASTDLSQAYTDAENLKNETSLSPDAGNTYFPKSMNELNAIVSAAGNGRTSATPLKNLFIVTDGMENEAGSNPGPMTSVTNEQVCSQFWDKGFSVYVLYTPYLPLPNQSYLNTYKQYAEPTDSSPDVAALKACARYPANFFEATDPTAINTAMQSMLAAALNTAGRITK